MVNSDRRRRPAGPARLSAWVNKSCSCSGPAGTAPKCWTSKTPCGAAPSPSPGPHPPPTHGALGQYRCLPEAASSAHFPHCDTSKTRAQRVESIVANLSAPELVDVILKHGVPRLDIPSYNMWADEALHGVRLWPETCPFPNKCTTIFPTASASSRAFNKSLWKSIGAAIGTEGRALFNLGLLHGELSLRGPQVNLQRDPRCALALAPAAQPCPVCASGGWRQACTLRRLIAAKKSLLGGGETATVQVKTRCTRASGGTT